MANDKFPKRVPLDPTELQPSHHFYSYHKENTILNALINTPMGENMDAAEYEFFQKNPPMVDENLIVYYNRIHTQWAAHQANGDSMPYFPVKDFTKHQLSNEYIGDPIDTVNHEGMFSGSSTVANQESLSGTVPNLGDSDVIKKKSSVPLHGDLPDVTKQTRDDVAAAGLHIADHDTASGPGFDSSNKIGANSGNTKVPISPLYPFTRMEPANAHESVFMAYNRNKLPIADIEHRKAFRHVFFGRPECYIFGLGGKISDQCVNDQDFASTLSRMPHVLAMLSPVYCTGAIGYMHDKTAGIRNHCNWNYLLSNRVQGFSVAGNSIVIDENMTKSLSENTIVPGGIDKGNLGSSLSLTFRDTKRLEIYEFIRMWMLYIHKRKRGILNPSMNNYSPQNHYYDMNGQQSTPSSDVLLNGHIYNRALEYCMPVWDIVTDETMTNILYWCKYYGAYPVELNNIGLSSKDSGAMTEQMDVEVSFKYQYRKEGSNMNLVEFNYNAGIVDEVGRLRDGIEYSNSSPFLHRSDQMNPGMNHIGASGMFTGTPYIIMEKDIKRVPITNRLSVDDNTITSSVVPQLRFMELPVAQDLILHAQSTFSNTLVDNSVNARRPINIP